MEDYAKIQPKKWYKRWWGIAIIIFIILFLSTTVALALSIINIIRNQPAGGITKTRQFTEEEIALINGSGKNYWLGASKPKVTIVEFADFTCPQCFKSFSKIREISAIYKNEVKIIYRDFPVISEESPNFALGARCAGEQGLFWPMHDKLFANQGIGSAEISAMAKQIGADRQKFDACLKSEKYLTDIQNDFEAGQKLGVTGTPTWFINGQMVEGDIPYDTFIRIIDDLLK